MNIWCDPCQRHHHPEASFCIARKPDSVLPPPTDEQITEQDRVEAEAIAKHEELRAGRKDPAWFFDGKQWRPRSRVEREDLESA